MKRFIEIFFAGLLAFSSLVLLYAYLAYPAVHVNCALRWGETRVDDYLKFVERDLAFPNITIPVLLVMSLGIKYEELSFVNCDDAKTYYFSHPRQLALEDTRVTPKEPDHIALRRILRRVWWLTGLAGTVLWVCEQTG